MNECQVPLCLEARLQILFPVIVQVNKNLFVQHTKAGRKPRLLIGNKVFPCRSSAKHVLLKAFNIPCPVSDLKMIWRQLCVIPPIPMKLSERIDDAIDVYISRQ